MTTFKQHLIIALHLFISTVVLSVAGSLALGNHIEWTTTFWIAVLLPAINAGVKVVIENFGPQAIGGKPR